MKIGLLSFALLVLLALVSGVAGAQSDDDTALGSDPGTPRGQGVTRRTSARLSGGRVRGRNLSMDDEDGDGESGQGAAKRQRVDRQPKGVAGSVGAGDGDSEEDMKLVDGEEEEDTEDEDYVESLEEGADVVVGGSGGGAGAVGGLGAVGGGGVMVAVGGEATGLGAGVPGAAVVAVAPVVPAPVLVPGAAVAGFPALPLAVRQRRVGRGFLGGRRFSVARPEWTLPLRQPGTVAQEYSRCEQSSTLVKEATRSIPFGGIYVGDSLDGNPLWSMQPGYLRSKYFEGGEYVQLLVQRAISWDTECRRDQGRRNIEVEMERFQDQFSEFCRSTLGLNAVEAGGVWGAVSGMVRAGLDRDLAADLQEWGVWLTNCCGQVFPGHGGLGGGPGGGPPGAGGGGGGLPPGPGGGGGGLAA